jgi:Glycosyl hydrolase family 47
MTPDHRGYTAFMMLSLTMVLLAYRWYALPLSASFGTSRSTASESDMQYAERALAVKQAFRHAYEGYKRVGWGKDEIRPISGVWVNLVAQHPLGLTLIDSLDTMLLMELRAEYEEALAKVRTVSFHVNGSVSVFETTIRLLGGLLSAYELTDCSEPMLLRKAVDLGQRLLRAFPARPSPVRSHRQSAGSSASSGGVHGHRRRLTLQDAANSNENAGAVHVPSWFVNLVDGKRRYPRWSSARNTLANVGSLQLEFAKLSALSGDVRFAQRALGVYHHLDSLPRVPPHHLFPVHIDAESGRFARDPAGARVTFGAGGDSCFEYLLKVWLLIGRPSAAVSGCGSSSDGSCSSTASFSLSTTTVQRLYFDEVVPRTLEHLVLQVGNHTVLGEYRPREGIVPVMDHLACFAGGLFALGAHALPQHEYSARAFDLGRELTRTCRDAYASTATGLGAERWRFSADAHGQTSFEIPRDARYLLVGGSVKGTPVEFLSFQLVNYCSFSYCFESHSFTHSPFPLS